VRFEADILFLQKVSSRQKVKPKILYERETAEDRRMSQAAEGGVV
jgi:hypothetical protein